MIKDISTDANTAVNGPGSVANPVDGLQPHIYGGSERVRPPNSSVNFTVSTGNFVKAEDYMSGDRPFLVSIGRDGLIAALQKLDAQLKNVSAPPPCAIFRLVQVTATSLGVHIFCPGR